MKGVSKGVTNNPPNTWSQGWKLVPATAPLLISIFIVWGKYLGKQLGECGGQERRIPLSEFPSKRMSWRKFLIRLLPFWISPIQRTTLFIPLEGTFTVLYHGIPVLYCTNKVLYHLCHISYIINFDTCIIISTCRTTATCAVDVGMSSLQLQQHMGWKSHNMCAEYISNSKQALN